MNEYYLDNASTTKPCPQVVDTMIKCLTKDYGNPSSLHTMGLNAQKYMDIARNNLANALSCNADNIFFTSGATESSNIAILGTAKLYGKRQKRVVTTTIEHASVKECFNELERLGFEVIRIAPNSNGEITVQDIVNSVNDDTILISCMLVNNETGYILPIEKAYTIIKKKYPNIITHCDCVQGFLKLPINVRTLKADLISISGHKIHAPKGVGALYVSKGVRIAKTNLGGKQEKGFRSGTEALPNIAGFGTAIEVFYPTIKERFEYISSLRNYLLDKISTIDWITLNSKPDASPYIVNISIKGIKSEIMLHFLETKGIYISSGSACSKGEKSGVLSQFGLNDKLSDCAIRVSFSESNTTQDIDALLLALNDGFNTILKIY